MPFILKLASTVAQGDRAAAAHSNADPKLKAPSPKK